MAPDQTVDDANWGRAPVRPYIVAELSTNWRDGWAVDVDGLHRTAQALRAADQTPLSVKFEQVINLNRQRGYLLSTFQLHRMMVDEILNETIIAVFVHEEAAL